MRSCIIFLIATTGDQMTFFQDHVRDTAESEDTFGQILAIAWIVSEIAIDVFGMLFWSGLALCFVRIITHG
jgi:hypothetical protein